MNSVFVLMNEEKTIVACIAGNKKGNALKESIQDAIADHLDIDSFTVTIRADVEVLTHEVGNSLKPIKFTVKVTDETEDDYYKEDYYLSVTGFY